MVLVGDYGSGTLGGVLDISGPWFPRLENRAANIAYFTTLL